ncbi:hypothetical protein DU508_05525 [Pedobacter chinensis]|uniref:DUF3883 domain-containing protein n=1 Tax=Pedobacter chinensis TaxID=2282421 RepID=A0A369PVH8_9SPHI|nr:hypothetical protein [Pedobacter chinensis]RDC56671.1 hypothetical protein DU508_05525 [Pedobacter chinensis]
MIEISITNEDIIAAKAQVAEFEKTDAGSWRYEGVKAWRGIVCEMVISRWFSNHKDFHVTLAAKGLDTSGKIDEFDFLMDGKRVEVKSATESYYQYIMPKIHDVDAYPKDIYLAAKYNDSVEPNTVWLIGYMTHAQIKKYPKEQDKGAPYYKVPIPDFRDITELKN